jgi:3-oxoacid CoA-transferase subunit A
VTSKKVYADAASALKGVVKDGMTLMCGGFGVCGIPENLIAALHASGVRDLTVVSNNAGLDGVGLGLLLQSRQIRKMISSYVGENKEFAGEVDIEFNPQGTMAERIRAGGAGIYGFFTKVGAGTQVAEGKETRTVDGETYVLEKGLVADVALVKAWKGDTEGNLIYRKTARNFNPNMATAASVTVAEVEELVEPGILDGDSIHTPGIFVQRIIQGAGYSKMIEKRTVRKRAEGSRAVVA